MLIVILMPFILALVAPYFYRRAGTSCIYCFAFIITACTYFLASHQNTIIASNLFDNKLLDFRMSFLFDGLSRIMISLVYGIGALVLIYSAGYLKRHPSLPRFLSILFIFMGAMGGLVLSNNLLLTFIFWEITSISSYLLIGFHHEDLISRKKALQALLVTGSGGLILMAGISMLYLICGTFEFDQILKQADHIRQHDLYTPAFICIAIGAMTKSAQFPFHFWLPNAMAAPTPISTYLHSATMVKAGIFLLARLFPILAGTDLWYYSLAITGAITMLIGAINGIFQIDLKRILAYSTLSVLGTLVMLLGLAGNSSENPATQITLTALVIYLVAHAFYKAGLFMVVGNIDHATGTRDIRNLHGLRKTLPGTANTAIICACSMAGLPLLLGFIGKELLYTALTEGGVHIFFPIAAFFASVLMFAMAFNVGLRPFYGHREVSTPRHPHKASLSMLIGPASLAILGIFFGLFPQSLNTILDQCLGAFGQGSTATHLHIFSTEMLHKPAFYMSLFTIMSGIILYKNTLKIISYHQHYESHSNLISPEKIYQISLTGLTKFAKWQTKIQQNGHLRFYVSVILIVTVVLIFFRWVSTGSKPQNFDFSNIKYYELALITIMIGAALRACTTRSRLTAAISLSVVGYGVTVLFVLFGAPDLAITQIIVETLTTVLMFLVLAKLPPFKLHSSGLVIARDLVIASSFGLMMTFFVLKATTMDFFPPISGQLSEWSKPLGHGSNIVNVILVDFRGLDTMGEIIVLAIAGLGIVSTIKLKLSRKPTKKARKK